MTEKTLYELLEKSDSYRQICAIHCSDTAGPSFGNKKDFIISEAGTSGIFDGKPDKWKESFLAHFTFNPRSVYVEKNSNGLKKMGGSGFAGSGPKGGYVDCVEVFQVEYPGFEKIDPKNQQNSSGPYPGGYDVSGQGSYPFSEGKMRSKQGKRQEIWKEKE